MNLCIYDPDRHNDYLSTVYFGSLAGYLPTIHGFNVRMLPSLDVAEETVMTHARNLTPEVILKLKEKGNRIVSMDINDHSAIYDTHRDAPEFELIDVVFKIAGIQKENFATDMQVGEDFSFNLSERRFQSDESWARYKRMHQANRLHPLPHVPWRTPSYDSVPHKDGKVLVRGGNHYDRFILFLNLLNRGLASPKSGFSTRVYFEEWMSPQFRYCDPCRQEWGKCGKSPYRVDGIRGSCNSPANWGDQGGSVSNQSGAWNNRCPRSFYWLARQFEERHGRIDPEILEVALNGTYLDDGPFYDILANASFYADLKWIYSIYAPPRFWEAAETKTVNLMPLRTNDQIHFPHIEEGVHYVTYKEDFSDLAKVNDIANAAEIAENSRAVHREWIKADTGWTLNTKLMKHIVRKIEEGIQ